MHMLYLYKENFQLYLVLNANAHIINGVQELNRLAVAIKIQRPRERGGQSGRKKEASSRRFRVSFCPLLFNNEQLFTNRCVCVCVCVDKKKRQQSVGQLMPCRRISLFLFTFVFLTLPLSYDWTSCCTCKLGM